MFSSSGFVCVIHSFHTVGGLGLGSNKIKVCDEVVKAVDKRKKLEDQE